MFCNYCGNVMTEDDKFCSRCGKTQTVTDQANIPPRYYNTPVGMPPAGMALKKPYAHDKKDHLYLIFAVLLGFLFCEFILFGGMGISVPLFIGMVYVFGLIYLRNKEQSFSQTGMWLFLPIVLVTLCFGLYDNGLLKFFNSILLIGLIGLQFTVFAGNMRYPLGSIGTIGDVSSTLLELPLTNMNAPFAILKSKKEDGKKVKNWGGILIGLLIAVPVAGVILALLISADAAFEKVMSDFADIFSEDLGAYIGKMILGTILAIPLFGGLYALRYKRRGNLDNKGTFPSSAIADSVIVNTVLAILCGIYVIYVLSQIQYLFAAFRNAIPGGVNAAEYARRGFFELMAVAAINLGVISAALTFTKKKEGKTPKSVRLLVGCISLFTLLLISSAFSKMVLYVNTHGLTLLRVYTSWFMLLLAIIFVAVFFKLAKPQFHITRFVSVVFLVLYIGLNYANVDALIPAYNIDRYQAGSLSKLDVEAFDELSDGMVPALIPLLQDTNPEVAQEAKILLQKQKAKLQDQRDEDGHFPWQKMSYAKWQALDLIEENKETIGEYDYSQDYYSRNYRTD